MLLFNFKKYFFLMVASALYSCQQHHRMEMGALLTKEKNESVSSAKYATLKTDLPKFIVVLLPSPARHASQTDKTKKALEKIFGEDVTAIQIKCLEHLKPTDQIGERHIEAVCKEILSTLKEIFDLKSSAHAKECLNVPMHILGYGQPNLVTAIAKAQSIPSAEFYIIFNITSLSIVRMSPVADIIDHQGRAKDNIGIEFFEERSIPDCYIDFLEKIKKQNESS